MDPKIIGLIATICIVNASVNIIDVNDDDAPIEGIADQDVDPAESSIDNRIRICSSSVCNRVCRLLKLNGKCVKKRCKCIPKGLSKLDDSNDEPLSVGLNFKESDEGSVENISRQEIDPADYFIEERLRICRFNICSRVCRALNKKGKCVKKRCKCVAKGRSADEEVEESENFDPIVKENLQEADIGIKDQEEDLADSSNEERIRICSSSVCKRACRLLQLNGKCVKKRCKCTVKASSAMANAALMVNDAENLSMFADD